MPRPRLTQAEIARNLIAFVSMGHSVERHPGDRTAVQRLRSLADRTVDRAVEDMLLEQIPNIWEGGWQPSELHRQAKRSTSSAAAARLVATSIAADHLDRPEVSLDPRWRDQITALELPSVHDRHGWFARWVAEEALDRDDALDKMLDAVVSVSSMTILKPLLPLPGIDGGPPRPVALAGTYEATSASDPVLERVRGLLAKAESTTFDAEAEAFTVKAQELITRHAIDTALLQAGARGDERPVMIRVPIDPPYADGKTLLLQVVAAASRCRVVSHSYVELATIVGFPDDVAATEMLFTSLLVQAQAALAEAAKGSAPRSRERRPGFRSAFFLSFADRIGDRLDEINEHLIGEADAAAAATGDPSALPILRAREARVDDLLDEEFGELASLPVRRGSDPAGWGRGRLAADQAQLDFGDLKGTAGGQTPPSNSTGGDARPSALPPG